MELSIKNLIKLCISICLIAFSLLTAGCSKKGTPSALKRANSTSFNEAKISAKGFNTVAMADSVSFDNAEYAMEEEAPMAPALRQAQGPQESQEEVFERKLIRTGNVSIEVQSVSDAEEKIAQWAKSLGGYVTNANTWEMGAGFTVRVPSERFDEAMADAGNFGRITNRSVNSQDVSDNYYDIKSRLETKYILRDKLTNYLSQAKDIKDLLEIERQLNSVIEDIESTESRFKRLSNQIDYSTIYIDMHFEHGKNES